MPIPDSEMRRRIKERLKGKYGAQRIDEIKSLLDEIPWTVGEYKNIISDLKRALSELNYRQSATKRGHVRSFRKESPQMVIIGAPNSGKSTLFSALTNAQATIADYPFSTLEPQAGILEYNDTKIQLVDTPPIYEGCSEDSGKLFALIRSGDGLIISINEPNEFEMIDRELSKRKIRPYDKKKGWHHCTEESHTYLPGFIAYRSEKPNSYLECVDVNDIDRLVRMMYSSLGIVRVYSRKANGELEKPPVLFINTVPTVKDFIKRLDKRLCDRFNCAKIWGPSAYYDGQIVGFDKILQDGDSVRIIEK